jgi:hypothetical protein
VVGFCDDGDEPLGVLTPAAMMPVEGLLLGCMLAVQPFVHF